MLADRPVAVTVNLKRQEQMQVPIISICTALLLRTVVYEFQCDHFSPSHGTVRLAMLR